MKRLRIIFKANQEFTNIVFHTYWYCLLLQISSIIFSGFSAAVVSKTTKRFVDSIMETMNLRIAMEHIIFMVVFSLVMNIVSYLSNTISNYAYSRAQVVSKAKMSSQISNLRLSFFDSPENINLLNRAKVYAENGGKQLFTYIFTLLTNLVGILSILSLLTPFSLWIVLFLVFLTLYRTVIEFFVSKDNYKFNKDKTLLDRKTSYFGSLLYDHNRLIDVNIYDANKFFSKKYQENHIKSAVLNRNHSIKINLFQIAGVSSIALQNLVLYSYIGMQLINGKVSFGDFSLFFSAVAYFNTMLSNFKKSISSFVPMLLDAQNYLDFLNVSEAEKYQNDTLQLKKITSIETIEFENVSFKYPQKSQYVLNNISFKLKPGDMVSIVGANGAGKTTIIKLILGFYLPTEGDIYINSISIKEIDIQSLWKLSGTIFQQHSIFALSAYDNIAFGHQNNNISTLMEQVGLKDRFDSESNGIYTELTRAFDSQGTLLSGGDSQKIALARLLYKKANLIILDEPSSSLDANAEDDLFRIIDSVHRNNRKAIVLFVSHRLSSSTSATRILFLKDGKLEAVGPHEELMQICNDYKQMFQKQASRYTNIT